MSLSTMGSACCILSPSSWLLVASPTSDHSLPANYISTMSVIEQPEHKKNGLLLFIDGLVPRKGGKMVEGDLSLGGERTARRRTGT